MPRNILPAFTDTVATAQNIPGFQPTELSVDDPKRAGQVVGHIMKDHKGEVDGALVNRLVREALEG